MGKFKPLQFAILLRLAVNSANILKGPASGQRMIAALNWISGFPLHGPRIENANADQRIIPESLRNNALLFRRGCFNDGE